MPDTAHEVILKGCTPEPLMSYLKSLGILRLVAEDCEHGDPDGRGFWCDDVFVVRSRLDEQGIEDFFLNHYRPTPIVAPWAGGSGFFRGDKLEFVDALANSASSRCGSYKAAISEVRRILSLEGVQSKPTDEIKSRLLRLFRSNLPDDLVKWMDSAMILRQDGQSFAPVLGTGGNDGRLDFTQNFMGRLVALGITGDGPSKHAESWLRHSLHGRPTTGLRDAAVGQFSPGRSGGPNATQGMKGSATDNPWDFVFMLEGTLVLAGTAVRRLGPTGNSRAAFPFTVRAADIGFTSAGRDESSESRGELWMPMWDRPSTSTEIASLFGEGRAEIDGRPVRDAVGFARAAVTLGVDRGISEFSRVSLLKRSGKAFLATPAGRIRVTERRDADLLREIDPWLGRFRKAVETSGNKPENRVKRFVVAVHAIETAVFDFCRYGGATHFQSILIALGGAEREMALTPAKIGQSKTRVDPIAGLSCDWVHAARGLNHAADEFQIALALAGIEGERDKIGPLRSNIEPVSVSRGPDGTYAKWADGDRSVVWNAVDLSTNLAAVLARRLMDGERAGCEGLRLAPARPSLAASPAAIVSYLRGELDDRRIENLLWGLMLVNQHRVHAATGTSAGVEQLPQTYCLLKLLFLPADLTVTRSQGRTYWKIVPEGERGTHRIRPEPAILTLLRAGRVGDAAAIAMRRLRASGVKPLPHRLTSGPSRDGEWKEARISPRDGQRLAGALLIPIAPRAINGLVERATRADEFDVRDRSSNHDESPVTIAAQQEA